MAVEETRRIVPRGDMQGSLGSGEKRWEKAYIGNVSAVYDTVADMVADLELCKGITAVTKGYSAIRDGGNGFYNIREKVVSDVDNGYSIIFLDNGDVAELIVNNTDGGAVNVKQFGAVGDGVTDDTAALRAAINSGYNVYVPKGHYILTEAIENTTGLTMYGDGDETILDFGDHVPSDPGLKVSGSLTQIAANISNATAGDMTVTFTSAHGLSVGDVFCIYCPNVAWSEWREYYNAGEWCRVVHVNGLTVTLENPLYDSYTGTSCDIYKMNSVPVNLHDFRIIGENTARNLEIFACKDFSLKDISAKAVGHSCVYINKCFNITIENLSVLNTRTASSTEYGVSIGNSQNIYLNAGYYYGTRHGIAIGGSDDVCNVTNRHLRFCNAKIDNDGVQQAADMHGNVEDVYYENCTILNGAGAIFAGKDTGYIGCSINTQSVCFYAYELIGGTFTLKDCKCNCYGDPDAVSRGYIDIGGNSDAVSKARYDMTFNINNIEIDFKNKDVNLAYVVKLLNRGTNYKLNVNINGITAKNMAYRKTILYTAKIAGASSNSDYIIVENINGFKTDTKLFVGTDGYLLDVPMRMQTQTKTYDMTIPSGSNIAITGDMYFKYKYPRIPAITYNCSAKNGANQSMKDFRACSFNLRTDQQRTVLCSTSNVTQDTTLDVSYIAMINEV